MHAIFSFREPNTANISAQLSLVSEASKSCLNKLDFCNMTIICGDEVYYRARSVVAFVRCEIIFLIVHS